MNLTSPDAASERLVDTLRLFLELLDLEPAARTSRLAAISGHDPEQAGELQAMLHADDTDSGLEIERHLRGGIDRHDRDGDLPVGAELGDYRVARRLGRGGMGEVYLATRRRETIEQSVALKLLRRELAEPRAIARFHRECRIQARLSHPAIVPLLDVGVAPDGRPFLVMPYIDGVPITEHADAHALPLSERIRLVAACCRAVESAHGRLVIHRDIKPSNILIGTDGQLRLLDFGVATALDDDSELTRQAPAPMTPERAAPEQLRGEPASTATDVWGLGVLLHELATGRLPYETREREPVAIEREIRRRGPTRPSRALPRGDDAASRAALESLAARRSTHPRRLIRELGGDFEIVLARALAAEPERRYASAAALGDDLERLAGQRPVAARPDSLAYRTRRFAGRHRIAVASSALAALSFAVLAMAIAVQSVRVARERDRATGLERQSTAVIELLTELFGATAPNRGAGVGEISIDLLLDQGAAKAEALLDSPGVRQRMFATLGRIRLERSELGRGIALLERARQVADESSTDPLDGERLAVELDYTRALARIDRGPEARLLLEPLIAALERGTGAHAAELAEALDQLCLIVPADEGPAIAERALELRRELVPPQPVEVASSLDALATLAFRRGERAAARGYWNEALPILVREVGEEDLRTLSTLNNLATIAESPADQLELLQRVIATQIRLLGPDAGPVANTRNNLGVALALLGRYEESERELRESYRLRVAVLGIDHREAVRTLRNVARIVELDGRPGEALVLFDEVLGRLPATGLPAESWPPFFAQRAVARWRTGDSAAAAPELGLALGDLRANYPAGHDEIATALLFEARFAAAQGDAAGALANAREALEARQAQFPPGSPKLAEAQAELGRALVLNGSLEEGRGLLAASLPALKGWGLLHPEDRARLHQALGG
jgi:eukaryotic-like serine/threonine-protein kinase